MSGSVEASDLAAVEDRHQLAEQSVAEHFSRIMRATSSPLGVLTDPPVVCGAVSVLVLSGAIVYHLALSREHLPYLALLVVVPLLVSVVVSFGLRNTRREVVGWLAATPFVIENMNAVLNGVGQNLEIHFVGEPPDRETINSHLEKVAADDCFALEFDPDEGIVPVRIGIIESKLNPAGSNHRRYQRVVALIEQALVPLSSRHPIKTVWIA